MPRFTAVEPAPRLDAWLAAAAAISRSRIQRAIEAGEVKRIDPATDAPAEEVLAARRRVAAGEIFEFNEPEAVPTDLKPQDIPLDIVFEDEHLLVINKPAGLVVHPAAGHPDGTLVNAVLHHCPGVLHVGGEERPGIVHRLDRDTSGLLVVAKTDDAMAGLVKAFAASEIRKTYLAVVLGVPEPFEGHIEGLIGRSRTDRKKMSVVENEGKFASTDYEVLEDFGNAALVAMKIHTGRTHQIRVHMSSIGCPVAGDDAYGRPREDASLPVVPERQQLHAWRLSFQHPITRKRLRFESQIPEDMQSVIDALRESCEAREAAREARRKRKGGGDDDDEPYAWLWE